MGLVSWCCEKVKAGFKACRRGASKARKVSLSGAAKLALLVGLLLGGADVASAADPLIPDIGVNLGTLVTEAGESLGPTILVVMGVAFAVTIVVISFRFFKRFVK